MATAETAQQEQQEQQKAVFPGGVELPIKHPLECTWVLWFDNPSLHGRKAQANWEDNLKVIYEIKFVEDFWGVFNNVNRANEIAMGANYHFFKKGVKPMWEDPANKAGGKWVVQVPRAMRDRHLNDIWQNLLLTMIGEQFSEFNEEVNGAVLSVRKGGDKISLWTAHKEHKDACMEIGRIFKDLIQYPNANTIGYQDHDAAMRKGSSFSNPNRYSI
eukprot:m.289149 g.289149  ORF g.289149 m.289149 type:complete len:216 (-) comp12084_c0_seq1:167-814(-)